MLKDKIKNKSSGLIFYSLSPPKWNTPAERVSIIAAKQMERINKMSIDGLIIYDIQDENQRTDKERPFEFTATLTPEYYAQNFLQALDVPKILYKSIANMNETKFADWLIANEGIDGAVFVGASSQSQVEATNFSLNNAYSLKNQHCEKLLLGGVTIPERHIKKGDEHTRIFNKLDKGCSFFVSQCVYSPNNTKSLLSDYYYESLANGKELCPMIFTLAPCGSLRTLHFMEWLGIDVPKWLYNDLKHSENILANSVTTCEHIAAEILEYASLKNIPVGFNIESVSIRREEIEAAGELLSKVSDLLKK
jgi:hypothetical protein